MAGILFLLAIAAIVASFMIPGIVAGFQVLLWAAAAVLVLFAALFASFKLYRKTAANEALVKTGLGGSKVILDAGDWIIPMVHQVVPVSLETMKLEVERQGGDALITNDNLRVDVKAEFFIRANPNKEDILQAARSLGHKSVDAGAVSRLVGEKLVSALRSVAAQKDLGSMHTDRKAFASAVQELVAEELSQNGLLLETVTISRLDQTDPHGLSDENIFDAQGKKKITEITAQARVERNRLEKEAEQRMTQQNVTTAQQVYTLEQQRATAQADQERNVANVQAERAREKQQFQIEQERAVRQAEIERELAVQAAGIERDKALILKEQERQSTDIARAQAIEVAERQKQIAIATQEAARAAAERDALAAQAQRESANQQVVTVTATAQAEREAQTKLIAAKQVIEQDKIKRQTDAEVAAFAEIRRAEAVQKAAELDAQAKLRLAEAEAQSREMVAKGDQAQKMVDINVEREKVNVEAARVEVERQSLENRQTYERAAIEFEVSKLRIEAGKDVQMALAKALGEFMSRGNYNIYGDPATMSTMFQQYTRGLGFGAQAEGVLQNLPDPLRNFVASLGDNADEILAALSARGGNGHPSTDADAAEASPPGVAQQVMDSAPEKKA
jgi:uncharacterized membrane protein YqiK